MCVGFGFFSKSLMIFGEALQGFLMLNSVVKGRLQTFEVVSRVCRFLLFRRGDLLVQAGPSVEDKVYLVGVLSSCLGYWET